MRSFSLEILIKAYEGAIIAESFPGGCKERLSGNIGLSWINILIKTFTEEVPCLFFTGGENE
jgi:hypothetical protein